MTAGESNYEIVEVRETTPWGEVRVRQDHQSKDLARPEPIRPTARKDDLWDEWGAPPSQQPKGSGWRGSGMIQSADDKAKPAPAPGSPEARARTRALAFSNERIPAVDLANAIADPEHGPMVAHATAIDLANRSAAAAESIDHMIGVWQRNYPELSTTIDLSRTGEDDVIDLATQAKIDEEIDLVVLQSALTGGRRIIDVPGSTRPWEEL